jgi:hypothetical protein
MNRILLLLIVFLTALSSQPAEGKTRWRGQKQHIYRFYLRDKKDCGFSLDHPSRFLSAKALERRRRQHLRVDSTDLPLSKIYLEKLRVKGTRIVGQSRWNNTVLVASADSSLLHLMAQLPFIERSQHVWTSPDSIEEVVKMRYHEHYNRWDSLRGDPFGMGRTQIEMLNGERLHEIDLRGQGMTIAVLDGGFQNVHALPCFYSTHIAGTHDFVTQVIGKNGKNNDDDNSFYMGIDHGTKVLSAMAAQSAEVLQGTAPEANYWLLRCEDPTTEMPIEEDYWAMAAEYADSIGADIINSSLGYNEFDNPRQNHRLYQLDGNTTIISQAASMLARKGIILVNSAGNTGMGPWKKICVPADAHEILTVGAITAEKRCAPFAAVGPTQDGRIKPDVVALGAPAALISGAGIVTHDMGTSFSTPVVCGLVACLWQAFPKKSAIDIINLVRKTADNYKTPDNVYGFGVPNFWKAYMIGKLE